MSDPKNQVMTPLEALTAITEKAAAKTFADTHSHGGSVQYCSDEYVPALHVNEGETLMVDWDCGGGKSSRIRDRLAALFEEKPLYGTVAVMNSKCPPRLGTYFHSLCRIAHTCATSS